MSLRESLESKAHEMGEKFVDITKKVFGRGIVGPFALQCIGDTKENLLVYDTSTRIPGSPDTQYSPNSHYIYGKPVSFGRRIAMEITDALELEGEEGLLKILS